ncbi:uncharacterized protein LOC105637593 isoform X1 [Jatropha curcas]|uniref:uncharacterized protein LOC105637593 isoform X1 n=2 Tax=Jatropha curcas TaxID=180498 RepID=UPI0005FB560C|nr:uncharacterized protein LOC105637593 isoform X1 [Jatropha curcas]
MDSSWKVKFGSTLQSSMPALASSTSREARDQMEIISSQYVYSHAGQDLRSQMHAKMPNPSFPNIANLSSCSSSHTDLGSSFVALLSGPASFLHFDFQGLSNPKPFSSSSKLPIEIGNITVSPTGSQVPVTSSGLLSENGSYQNLRSGADLCSIVSSRTMASSNSVFQHGLLPANISLKGSGLTKTVSHQAVLGNEKIKDFASLRGEWHGMPLADAVKLQNVNNLIPQRFPVEAESSALSVSSTSTSGCPRVFCLDRSGDLLLSNTGLLGILCSCHCFHMSVAKFCEHSGVLNVNPGDAVRMDSGETIAQWRKLYFQKFGIRVPEDQSGWDWPEGLPLTASLVKSGVTMSNIVKNSDCSNLVGASGGSVRSGQSLGDVFPANFLADHNSVIDALHDKQQRNGQDSNKFYLKGLVASSQSNSCSVGDNHMTDCSISRCMTMPELAGRGPENISQSIYIDAVLKSRSLAAMNQTLQNHRITVNDSDVSRSRDARGGTNMDKDASSSGIELKLGQPYQQSQAPRTPVSPVVGQFCNTLVNSQRPFCQEQMIHNVTSCRGEEESGIFLPCPVGLSNFTSRREQEQLNYGNCVNNNMMNAAKSELLGGNVAKPSVVSLFKHCNLPEGSSHSMTTSNLFNVGEHVRLGTKQCESHAVKAWNSGNGIDRQNMVPQSGFLKPADKGKGVEGLGKSYTETTLGSKMHNHAENPSSSTGVVAGNSYSVFPHAHDKNRYSHYSPNVLPDASDAGNFSNYLENVPCFGSSGPADHVFLRSMGSTMASRQLLSSSAVPLDSNLSSSTAIPGLTPAMPNQESIGIPHLLDDNLRWLALGQILELSKQQHALASLGKNLEQGKCSNSSDVKVQHSFVEPSMAKEQMPAHNLNWKQGISEVALKSDQSGPTSKMVNDNEFSSVTGLNRWCKFSTFTQGMSLHCKEIGMHCQSSHSPLQNEQPLLRLGRCQNNTPHSNEHESCCPRTLYFQYNCSCPAHNCIGGQCNFGVGNPPNSVREETGSVSCKTPMIIASQFAKDHVNPKENAVSDQYGNLRGQLSRKISFCASQWKDVPSKVKRVPEVACVKASPDALYERGHELRQLEDNAAKCSNGAVHRADSLKKQDISNISSGCSTPAVTQASIEVTDVDSSTVGNNEYANNLVIDEGSGIDKCWSSDDAFESDRTADFCGASYKTNLRKEGSHKVFGTKSSRSLLDEVKLMDSLTWKRGRNQKQCGTTDCGKTNQSQESEKGMKTGKRKREIELKMLDAPLCTKVPVVHCKSLECDVTVDRPFLSNNVQLVSSGLDSSWTSGASFKTDLKHGNSALSVTKTLSCKRDLCRFYNAGDGHDHGTESNHNDNSCNMIGISGRKKFRRTRTADICMPFQMQELTQAVGEKILKNDTVSWIKPSSSRQVNLCYRKAKPVVCGKYGEISNGHVTGEVTKPVKIFPLDKILKTARRCSLPKNCKPGLTSSRGWKRTNFRWNNVCSDKFFNLAKEKENNRNDGLICEEMNVDPSLKEAFLSGDEQSADEFSILEKREDKNEKGDDPLDSSSHVQTKPKYKETRKRSLYELTLKGKSPSPKMISQRKIFKCEPKMKLQKNLKNSNRSQVRGSWKVDAKRHVRKQKHPSVTDMDSFCCVCGSSNKDEVNDLLECGQCSIRVHQACYGVSKVPKGLWYCRPCKTNSKNIVCVLCGYGGGAMTQALRSRTIVKTLLKAWNLETECRQLNSIPSAEIVQEEFNILHSSGSIPENSPYAVVRPTNIEPSTSTICNMDVQNQSDILQSSLCRVSNLKVHTSITAGVLDSNVKQWVHMVCGLWTPGTRCPNVDTMSAFDVSGISRPKTNAVCSVCNRPGGSCIQCRVENCSVQFHPWCAHQKGLLQSEAEGVDNENVGFYGRCELHATYTASQLTCDVDDIEAGCTGESCARTEGYKGRKRDGFWHSINWQSKGKGGCLVPQEQLNAWIHINGQKSCSQGLLKLPISEKEYDCRKEYARYKQLKGWKHLVVYKSGIHALGLYTSRFICRGEMVVEYVGEIVGQRVADKRENEYQCGRKLQYKSACYFFRIDKEHIIDATQKGGIARFVNHSCLPNCVAKVISVRTEKKVVFFAERDIYPGEEITYDYHFNHEDEGKKIPCFCNSKNCRRYLN